MISLGYTPIQTDLFGAVGRIKYEKMPLNPLPQEGNGEIGSRCSQMEVVRRG